MNRYYNPVRTVEGAGCAGHLEEILEGMDLSRKKVLLLAWGEGPLENPAFAGLLRGDGAFEVHPMVFRASNPTVEQLFDAYRRTKDFAPEVVVAVGGGSILDVGKSLCCQIGRASCRERV